MSPKSSFKNKKKQTKKKLKNQNENPHKFSVFTLWKISKGFLVFKYFICCFKKFQLIKTIFSF